MKLLSANVADEGSSDDPVVVACVRDEMLRLPAFLDHYRRLGVAEFHIVDNDSSDDTTDYLSAQPGVCVYHTTHSYAEAKCGKVWLNSIIRARGAGQWILTVDADELFIFPEFESVPIRELCRFLDDAGNNAMVALMIDMYPRVPIALANYVAGGSLLDACPYFDSSSYVKPHPQFLGLCVQGGPRGRLFSYEHDRPGPFLGKVPLVRWNGRDGYPDSTHWLDGFSRALVSGALLHFKYLQDFSSRVVIECEREEHWNRATEYKSYAQRLVNDPSVCFYSESESVRFEGSRQLVDLDLMKVTESYMKRFNDGASRGSVQG